MRVWLVLGLLLASGCLEPAPPADDSDLAGPTPPPAPLSDTIYFQDCQSMWGLFMVPKSAMAPFMPAGFQPSQASQDRSGQLGTANIFAFSCQAAELNGTDLGPVEEFWGWLGVIPPEAYRCACGSYWVPIGMFTETEALASLWQDWSMGDVREAPIHITIDDRLPISPTGTAVVDAATQIRFQTAAGQARASAGLDLQIRMFGVEDGEAVHAIDMHWKTHMRASGYGGYSFTGEDPIWDPLPKPAGAGNAYHVLSAALPFHFNVTKAPLVAGEIQANQTMHAEWPPGQPPYERGPHFLGTPPLVVGDEFAHRSA